MKEQLFIIKDCDRFELDLNNPSGISLNYKSYIFGDLSKITCSHTYTFKLPFTLNNRTILDNAEEIRQKSSMLRHRLKAEFYQNGIQLFKDANLYIDTVEGSYNAVLTWGVLDGMEKLKDDDVSIQQLCSGSNDTPTVNFGYTNSMMSGYNNNASVLRPVYNAGLKYIDDSGWFTPDCYSVFPLPVVPIFRLIALINAKYGTKFNFGTAFTYNGAWDESQDPLIQRGVIPLVKIESSADDVGKFAMTIPQETTLYDIPHILKGAKDGHTYDSSIVSVDKDANGLVNTINYNGTGGSLEIDGYFVCQFTYHRPKVWPYTRLELTSAAAGNDCIPELLIYKRSSGGGVSSVGSIKGKWRYDVYADDGNTVTHAHGWVFNFSKEWGGERISTEIASGDKIFFAFNSAAENFNVGSWIEGNMTKLYRTIDITSIDTTNFPSMATDVQIQVDVMSNLPDISCMTLLKNLFFMMGAFPYTDTDGNIKPMYYSNLKDNIESGNVLDWSKKINTSPAELPSKISYEVSGYAQRNYFLMKNDSLEVDKDKEEDDVYASGIGWIDVDNELLERNKTIIQVPFYGPYIKDNKNPKYPVGIMKFWYLDSDNKPTAKEAKPCVGIIKDVYVNDSDSGKEYHKMGMDIWNEFINITNNRSYQYLSEILENPVVITETLNLNEFDLRDIDYSVPVYLNKYNSYFAVVSIKRDSKGKCKCELIKLP